MYYVTEVQYCRQLFRQCRAGKARKPSRSSRHVHTRDTRKSSNRYSVARESTRNVFTSVTATFLERAYTTACAVAKHHLTAVPLLLPPVVPVFLVSGLTRVIPSNQSNVRTVAITHVCLVCFFDLNYKNKYWFRYRWPEVLNVVQ